MENKDIITLEKVKKYKELTSKALKIAKKSIVKGKEKEAAEIIEMVSNYLSDSEYFEKNQDFINAFGALNYSHGWLDCGVRLGIFNVNDNRFFTVR
ncbi:DUF357 domain-containing protein [Candidatus Pacearchaeota archaeon]|nr:DUF357 domain-containing protein [Candidatus Pacearchaeota archaeon]